MPPRPPPSPPVLTVLCSVLAVLAAWLSLAIERLARGLVLEAFGVPMGELSISRRSHYLLVVPHGSWAALGPWELTVSVACGTLAVIVLALALQRLVSMTRSPGWLRAFALVWVVVALLWIPYALAAASVRGGSGPLADLYARLGRPQAGRWAVAALGLVLMVLAAGRASSLAVAVGRSWMRADGLQFRRRLVRVVAGWPAVTAAAVLAALAGWASQPWQVLVPAAALAAFHYQTR